MVYAWYVQGGLVSVIEERKYTGLRAALWPIASYELKKVIPMSLLLFCMLYDYTCVRILKDALIVMAPGGGETVLPFLKLWCVLPSAILFVVLYAKISAKYSKEKVFYGITIGFTLFFLIFGNILFPMKESLHLSPARIAELQLWAPRLSQVIAMMGMWTYSLFYVFAELWGTVGITVLFWQFANQITPTFEAKRYYISFQSIGNFALLAGASVMTNLFGRSSAASEGNVGYACNLVVIVTLIAISMYYYVNRYVLTDPRFPVPENKIKKSGPKPGLMEGFKIILQSKYLGYIALLIIAYGVSINFVEVTWKGMLRKYAIENPHLGDANGLYVSLQSQAFFWTGIAAIAISTIGKSIVQRLGWRITALVTPIGMLITSLLFFGCILAPNMVKDLAHSFNLSVLGFGVWIGVLQQVFTKSAKYVLFDTTKEMAYIPLPEELKVQGKAAVEVVAGRAGKSLGGMIQTLMILVMGTKDIFMLTPALAIGSVIVVLIWIITANKLATEYQAKISEEIDIVKR